MKSSSHTTLLEIILSIGLLSAMTGCGESNSSTTGRVLSSDNKAKACGPYTPPSVSSLVARADAGDSYAQALIGHCYANGELGLTTDYDNALKYLQAAKTQGHPLALYSLAYMYRYGFGVKSSKTEAEDLCAMAFSNLLAHVPDCDPIWQLCLADSYHYGWGVKVDCVEAAKWYSKVAEQDYRAGPCMFTLGKMYEEGENMPTNYVEAARWYLKAAEKGDAYSQKRLGFMYETGQGVQTDLTEAAKWYRTAKDNGLPLTQRDLYRVLYKDQTPQWRFRDNPTVRGKSYASDGGVTIQLYPVDNKPRFLLVGLLFNFEPEEHQLKRSFVVTTTNNDFVCGDPSFSIFNHTEDETLVLLTFDNTAGWNVDKEYRLHGLSQSSSFTPTEDK